MWASPVVVQDAAETITKALAFGTRDSHIYYHASMIYFRAEKVPLSREMAKKAIKILTPPQREQLRAKVDPQSGN